LLTVWKDNSQWNYHGREIIEALGACAGHVENAAPIVSVLLKALENPSVC
jgi:hypothetical protein